MTTHDKDKIIAAAIGCIEGPYDSSRAITIVGNEIERFYAIAFEDGRQAEREECAKVCIHNASDYAVFNREPYESMEIGALSCAFSIRARGDTK